MATFRANKGYSFSADGTPATTWAKFEKVPDTNRNQGEPAVYEFDTTDRKAIASLRKLIKSPPEGYADITEVKAGQAGSSADDGDADSDDSASDDSGDGSDTSGSQGE